MELIALRRLGGEAPVFDGHLERGFTVAEGDEVSLSERTALDLLRDEPEGWELAAPPPTPEE